MKVEELMIGDWFKVDDTGNFYQVEYITKELDEIRVHLKGTCCFATENDIEPIPITDEILEKNGYVRDGYFYKKGEIDRIQLGRLFEHASVVFYKDGLFREVSTSPYLLQYVHQLQHALRLCGINKEIVL